MKKIKKEEVYNFNAHQDFSKLLFGNNFDYALNEKTLTKIPNPQGVKAISINSFSNINKKTLELFPKLQLIITRTVGVNHVDMNICKSQGIEVRNIPDYGSFAIAEHTLALLLSASRRITELNNYTHSGKFDRELGMSFSLEGKTLGVIGSGKIGIETIKLAKAFKMNVIAYDVVKNPEAEKIGFKYVSIEDLLHNSDVICLHIPLLDETRHFIDDEKISKMKDEVILVNTSRGEIIDTQDLINNIKKFKYVCLDVLEGELSFTKAHPLLKYPNVTITPHVAFFTDTTVQTISKITNQEIESFFANNK